MEQVKVVAKVTCVEMMSGKSKSEKTNRERHSEFSENLRREVTDMVSIDYGAEQGSSH